MKICAIICELNPLHNGHKYLFDRAREISGCDLLLLIMSGSFSQRGEMCILDKYTRSKHAILSGADAVIELPASFAVAPAQVFAQGAVKILSSIPEVTTVAFGCEDDNKDNFIRYATLLLNETYGFKQTMRKLLMEGKGYIKAYNTAFEQVGGSIDFISKPNNTLALEYTKSILLTGQKIDILPIKRIGNGFNQVDISENFTSASGIRNNIKSPLIKENVPECVYNDLQNTNLEFDTFDKLINFSLLNNTNSELAEIYGCNEGLQNKLKSLYYLPFKQIVQESTSLRYSSSRISRILTANLLNLTKAKAESYLQSDLYIQPLAIRDSIKDTVLSSISKSKYPILSKQRDLNTLTPLAKECYDLTKRSYDIWNIIANRECREFDYIDFI